MRNYLKKTKRCRQQRLESEREYLIKVLKQLVRYWTCWRSRIKGGVEVLKARVESLGSKQPSDQGTASHHLRQK
jgi:hypothetical protein